MSDIRDRADEWLTKVNAWHPDVTVDRVEITRRMVRCDLPDGECAGIPDIWYARNGGGGHGHWKAYETPHERIVMWLPVEPVQEQP